MGDKYNSKTSRSRSVIRVKVSDNYLCTDENNRSQSVLSKVLISKEKSPLSLPKFKAIKSYEIEQNHTQN